MRRLIFISWFAAALFVVGSIIGCSVAARDRGVVYTEEAIDFADQRWDAVYAERLAACMRDHLPQTPGAEKCFGPTFATNARVEIAVRSAVALLRSYWAARRVGESPSYAKVVSDITMIFRDLPPQARDLFLELAKVPTQ